MHFPFYVAMWFGTTPDDQLVDPGFPRRFVPRAFDAIMRHTAHEILPSATKLASPKLEVRASLQMIPLPHLPPRVCHPGSLLVGPCPRPDLSLPLPLPHNHNHPTHTHPFPHPTLPHPTLLHSPHARWHLFREWRASHAKSLICSRRYQMVWRTASRWLSAKNPVDPTSRDPIRIHIA